jgi:hypothetical protein
VGSQVFLMSDFADLDDVARRHLNQLARSNQTRCILVHDPLESAAPIPGHYRVSNGNAVRAIGTASAANREAWAARFNSHRSDLARLCLENRAGFGLLSTADFPVALEPGWTPPLPVFSHSRATQSGSLR